MKNLILTCALAGIVAFASAQDFPQPSPRAQSLQMVGLTEMDIEYSRPGVKDRKIFGELVPYGELWRTGANSATKVTFSKDVSIDGKPVKAGSYSVFTIPMEDKIMVMFNSNPESSTGEYDKNLDVVTVEVPFEKSDQFVERMRFNFENVKESTVDLVFNWANRTFTVPISVDTEAHVEARLEERLREKDLPFTFYRAAADYYIKHDKDPKKAVEWAEKSVDSKAYYWNVITLAQAYAAAGNKEKAIEAAERSKKLAQEAGADYYVKLNDELIARMNQ